LVSEVVMIVSGVSLSD